MLKDTCDTTAKVVTYKTLSMVTASVTIKMNQSTLETST